MNELMRDGILDQPAALAACLPDLRRQLASLDLGRPRELVLTGSGDSYFAPLALLYAARLHTSAAAQAVPAMEAAHYMRYGADTLLVAISVSGEGARTLAAAEAAREAGAPVLAVTAEAQSTLAGLATSRLVLGFKERSRETPHTTDFLTTLLAVAGLVERLGSGPIAALDALPALALELVPALERPCTDLGNELAACTRFTFLGSGPSFGVAQYAAEKFWEAGGLEAYAFELEELAHGPHFLLEQDDPVVIVAPPGRSSGRAAAVAAVLHDLGARPVELDVPGAAGLPEEWSPFATAVAAQWLCLAVANAKGWDVVRKDGRHADPGRYGRAHSRLTRG